MKKLRQGGFLVAKIHQLSGRIFARILKKNKISEINPAQGRILFVLWENDGIPIMELSKKTQLEKSTLTAMLDRLEQDGYIKRIASNKDRRKLIIKRTEKDLSFQKSYYRVSAEMSELFYQGFTPEEVDLFEEYLRKIYKNLVNYQENFPRPIKKTFQPEKGD